MIARDLPERVHFAMCRALGRLLRSARYSTVRILDERGELQVRKRRRLHAPLLIALSGPLAGILDTGVRVLPQRQWEERERELHARMYGASIRIDADGTLILPCLAGETLAALLERSGLEASVRNRAITLAVLALAEFHARGFTHGDAMAENVMVDLETDVARWIDFETVHDPGRPVAWRRADDVRALLSTCLLRTSRAELADTIRLVLDVYADDEVIPLLVATFGSPCRRPMVSHLGQAGLSFRHFREIDRVLTSSMGRRRSGSGAA